MQIGYFTCIDECASCICLMPVEVCSQHWVPRTGVMDSYEPPCGCWKLNLDPVLEQQVLLTLSSS